MMEDQPPHTSPDGSRKRKPPGRCPRPQDSTQEDLTISHKSDSDNSVKEEIKEEEEEVGVMEISKGHKDPLKRMEMEQFSDTNPPERCPRPLDSQDYTEEDLTIPYHDQGEEQFIIKAEIKEEEVEMYMGGGQPSTEEVGVMMMMMKSEQDEISLPNNTNPGTRLRTRRMEAATAHAVHVSKTRQRGRTKQRATPMSFEEMVEMVKILEKEDYDSRLAIYEKTNLRKDLILEKVIEVLRQNFSVQRTKDQLRKRWSDLKLREEDQLKRILKVIKIRSEKNKKVQNVNARVNSCTQSQRVGDVMKRRYQDGGSVLRGCHVPGTPEVSGSVQDPRPDAATISGAMEDLKQCCRDLEVMQKRLTEMQGTLNNVMDVLTKF